MMDLLQKTHGGRDVCSPSVPRTRAMHRVDKSIPVKVERKRMDDRV
jgi:hypothetical protein